MRQSELDEYGTDGYDCPVCSREFDTKSGRGLHFTNSHPNKDLLVELYGAETIRELYQKMSKKSLGVELGFSDYAIDRTLDHLNMDRRSHAEAMEKAWSNGDLTPKMRGGVTYAHFATSVRGYERWRSSTEEGYDEVKVHRLLATLLVEDISELKGMHVHHKNEHKWDNRLENIQIMTQSDHIRHHQLDDSS